MRPEALGPHRDKFGSPLERDRTAPPSANCVTGYATLIRDERDRLALPFHIENAE
jgi:hypothetical protein